MRTCINFLYSAIYSAPNVLWPMEHSFLYLPQVSGEDADSQGLEGEQTEEHDGAGAGGGDGLEEGQRLLEPGYRGGNGGAGGDRGGAAGRE